MLVFVCWFGVEVSRYATVFSQRDTNVKEGYVSRRVWTGEFNLVHVVKIIDENFKVIRTFGPDHKNIIDISAYRSQVWGWNGAFSKALASK